MGRWRPPPTGSSPYVTAAGYARLEAELKALWERRTDVVRHLAAAAAEGDRSENAEYLYRKRELAGIDRRIRYLQRRLPGLTVVRQAPGDPERVFFGAWVTVAAPSGGQAELRIVGADEIDTSGTQVSVDAPMARALLGRRCGDEVVVRAGSGDAHWTIVAIRYDGA